MNLPAFLARAAELQRRRDEHVAEVWRTESPATKETGTTAAGHLDDRCASDAWETEGGCASSPLLTV